MAQKTTLKDFEAVFPKLEEELVAHAKKYGLPDEYVKWYRQVGSTTDDTLGRAELESVFRMF